MNRSRLIGIGVFLMLYLGAAGDHVLAQQPLSQSSDGRTSARSSDDISFSKLLAQARPNRRPLFSLMPESRNTNLTGPTFSIAPAAVPILPVTGTGTLGRLTKWSGFNANNSVIGDSTIFEDKFGKVGVGTDSPGSRLTVAGMIEAKGADGGIKFPDGTVQTTSASGALRGVVHDQTLMGGGTTASPLGVASPLMVRDLDNPARQPVTFSKNRGDDPFTVPAGKLLVIEFVSGVIRVVDGDELRDSKVFPVAITEAGQSSGTLHFILGNAIDVSFGSRTFGISQTLRLYASPGSLVQVFPSNLISFGQLTVSGYYVDVGDATPVNSLSR
jgi:hypothetical protein